MATGQTHFHLIKFSSNKLLQGEIYKNNTGNLKILTCYQMMVISECPVDNNAVTISTNDFKID